MDETVEERAKRYDWLEKHLRLTEAALQDVGFRFGHAAGGYWMATPSDLPGEATERGFEHPEGAVLAAVRYIVSAAARGGDSGTVGCD